MPGHRRGLRRRRREPRHALEPARRSARRQDNGLLAILVVLVLTSGFVVGTTAAFTATTTNPNNVYATTALNPPTSGSAEATGDTVVLKFAAPTEYLGDGYVMEWKDGGRINADGSNPSPDPCSSGTFTNPGTAPSQYTKLENGTSPYTWIDGDAATNGTLANNHGATYTDGRSWCYRVRSASPCCTVLDASTWYSIGYTAAQEVVGYTIRGAALVNGGTVNNLDAGDYLELTFNQYVNKSTPPTGDVCMHSGPSNLQAIYFGLNDQKGDHKCNPDKGDKLYGFMIRDVNDSSGWKSDRRLNMVVEWANCNVANTGCKTLRLKVGSTVINAGSGSTIPSGASFKAYGNGEGTTVKSLSPSPNGLVFCPNGVLLVSGSSGTGVTMPNNYSITLRDDPANGRCALTTTGTL